MMTRLTWLFVGSWRRWRMDRPGWFTQGEWEEAEEYAQRMMDRVEPWIMVGNWLAAVALGIGIGAWIGVGGGWWWWG